MRRGIAETFLAFCLMAAPAFSGPPSSKSNANIAPVEDPPDSPRQGTTADPIGYADGSVFDVVEDLRVSCPDIDLVFRRAYCSRTLAAGPLGFGWTHSYEWRLEEANGSIRVRSAGEAGPSDAVHTFAVPAEGGSAFNADGYRLDDLGGGEYSVTTPEALTYSFNSAGRLSSISAWNGTAITLERDRPSGPVSRASHPCGKWLGFEYGEDGSLARVTTPDENVFADISVGGHGAWRVLEMVVRHDGAIASTNSYRYSSPPAPGSRDAMNGLRSLPSGGGASPGNCVAVQMSQARASRAMPKAAPAALNMASFQCPALSRKTDANGLSSSFYYIRLSDDLRPQCSHMEMDGGLFSTSLAFGAKYAFEERETAWGTVRTSLLFDGKGREFSRTTGGETLSKTYGGGGDLVRERLASSATGAFVENAMSHDARHRVVSAGTGYCAAPSRFTRISWDDRRNIPRRTVSPEGRISEWTTNGLDVTVYGAGTNDSRLVSQILMTGNERPRALVSPDGGRIDISYDDTGYATNIAPQCLPPVSLGYDALGHVSSLALPGPDGTERGTALSNNWRGNPLSVTFPDGTEESFEYEGNGRRVTRHTDALGREDAYKWVLGLPVHAGRIVGGVTNTLFGVEHDPQLNVVAITDPMGRRAETYVLDENERVVAVTNVEGQVMSRQYAVGGFVSSETRFDGTAVEYGYDADGNLATIAYPDSTLSFSYDGDGLSTSASNGAGTVSNEYDAATGWLVSSHGADGTTVEYSRRNGGDAAAVSSVAGTTAYSYDNAGRWTGIDSPAGAFGFAYCDWNGRLAAVTNGHGLVAEYAYDIMDRVTNIVWRTAEGASLGGFAYSYDAAGRIVSRSHSLDGSAFDRQYAYDDLDRLVSDGGVSYAYDAAGNRASRVNGGAATSYALGTGDRLASWTGGSYSYNAAGCVTHIERVGRPTLDLAWNGQYQLVSVSTNGVFAEGYAYDALGRRVSTTNAEGTVMHVYDDGWQCVADIDGQGNVVASYVWGEGIDNLLAVKIGDETYYPLTDVQGTVWGYADAGNNVVARWTYDAWGNVLSEVCTVPALATLRYRFQGREWSAATGLVNFRMRWYDSETGRWLSKDPIGLGGGVNLYAFCGNDPINITDFLGLCESYRNGWRDKFTENYNNLLSDYSGYFGLYYTDLFAIVDFNSFCSATAPSFLSWFADKAAESQIRDATIAGALFKGSIPQKIAAAEEGAKLASRLSASKAALGTVSKATGAVGWGATVWSWGVRCGFAINAAVNALLE